MSVKEIRDLIFENYYKWIDCSKETLIIQQNAWKKLNK